MSIDMLTNIENNIKLHFIKYVFRFVNSSFKKQNNELLEKCEKGTKTKIRKELNKDLYEIKEDLLRLHVGNYIPTLEQMNSIKDFRKVLANYRLQI